jgi:hypothetical protein
LLSVAVVPEAAPVSVIVTPASGAVGRRGRASPPPPLVDTVPERLNVPPPVGVPVKFWPVTLAPLTVTLRLAGVKVYPVREGVTV